MKLTFCLRDAKADGPTPLYAFIHWTVGTRHNQWKLATGARIDPRLWDAKRKKAKHGAAVADTVNSTLAKIETDVRTAFGELEALHKPITPEAVRERFNMVAGKVALQRDRDFFDDHTAFVAASGVKRKASTLQIHKTTIGHVKDFAKAYGLRITYEQWTVVQFDRFLAYLLNVKQLNNATTWKTIRTLRVFLRHAVEQEWTTNATFLKFTAKNMPSGEPSEKVYVTAAELELVKALDLSDNRRMDITRDLFLFQCATGLRYGDLQAIGPDHINDNTICLVTGKNKKAIRVPLLPAAKTILQKYEGQLPRRSNQKQNAYLKNLMREAKITRPVTVVDYSGVKRIERTVPKADLIGTHSAKRSFVSILRQHGVTVESICRITGNSRVTIEKYILKDEADMASELAGITAFG